MAEVHLREITADTFRSVLALSVSESQRRFVAANAASIAEAYFHPEAWIRAIYADDVPVGFLMLHDEHLLPEPREVGYYYLWRFMIDHRFQGLGYGRRAMHLLIEHVRTRPHALTLLLSHGPGDGSAGPFYQKLGFSYTGKEPEGELEMSIELANFRTDPAP